MPSCRHRSLRRDASRPLMCSLAVPIQCDRSAALLKAMASLPERGGRYDSSGWRVEAISEATPLVTLNNAIAANNGRGAALVRQASRRILPMPSLSRLASTAAPRSVSCPVARATAPSARSSARPTATSATPRGVVSCWLPRCTNR